MSNKKNQPPPPAGTPPAEGNPPGPETNATEQDWALKLPKYRVPTPQGLIVVTAEVLHNDPDLLAMMISEYPDCFSQLPAPAEPTE